MDVLVLTFLAVILITVPIVWYILRRNAKSKVGLELELENRNKVISSLKEKLLSLNKYSEIRDVNEHLEKLNADIRQRLNDTNLEIANLYTKATEETNSIRSKAEENIEEITKSAILEAEQLRRSANSEARLIRERAEKVLNDAIVKSASMLEDTESSSIINQNLALEVAQLNEIVDSLTREVESLSKYKNVRDANQQLDLARLDIKKQIRDAENYISSIRNQANSDVENILSGAAIDAQRTIELAQSEAETLLREISADVKAKSENAEEILGEANRQAEAIIKMAEDKAEQIAGDAYLALNEANRLQSVIEALKNKIDGYGDKYVLPTYGLLDQLAELYSYEDAGEQLRLARYRTKRFVSIGRAAECDYVEPNRARIAKNFVVDAFNGKVDSILARSKTHNFGVLKAEINDAFILVNHNGIAFRNARITKEYLTARITELRWVVAVHEVREAQKEQQRRIKEQLREEKKARLEYERAIKEAANEEASIQQAMESLRIQLEKASEEQKAEFEFKLSELQEKLVVAEAKNQRALSMAQQTKTGHVYIISNIGSFGENVYKVGMTRRLEPVDRVKELGGASVPFPFDVHAMIWSEDAPALERDLHRYFLKAQMNKVNPRKEFFKLSIDQIKSHVDGLGHKSSWTLTAAAVQYRETLEIEKLIESDPATAQEWTIHQLKYEPEFDYTESEDELE